MIISNYDPSFVNGDIIVYVCNDWENYTEGRQYTVISQQGSLIDVKDDNGTQGNFPCLTYSLLGVKGFYFIGLDKYRELEIKKLLNDKR